MAENYWRGDAAAVGDVWTVTVTGPATSGGTVAIPIGTKKVTVAFANGETAAIVAARLGDALANSQTPEFAELSWTYPAAGTVVTGTGKTAGVPSTVSAAVVTGTGIAAPVAHPTAATGRNHADNPLNWSAGHLPGDGGAETVVIDGGADILYGLAGMYAGACDETRVRATYGGAIGLPRRNATGGGDGYWEYRDRAVSAANAGDVYIGEGATPTGGGGPTRCFLLLGASQNAYVYSTGTSPEDGVPAADFGVQSGTPAEVRVFGGAAGWAAQLPAAVTLPVLTVTGGAATVRGGVTALTQRGGAVTAWGAVGTLTIKAGEYTQAAGQVDTIEATGGSVRLQNSQGANAIAAHFRATATGDPPYLDLTGNDRQGRVIATGSYFRAGAYLLDPYKSADVQAVTFEEGSMQASVIGDEFQVTRAPA